MLIPLAASIILVLEEAASRAIARSTPIEVRDLLSGLSTGPLGGRLATALRPMSAWTSATETYAAVPLSIHTQGQAVPFNTETQRLYLAGAEAVILGPYEAHHLAQAIGVAATLHPERFTGFGFVAMAWQQALQGRSANR